MALIALKKGDNKNDAICAMIAHKKCMIGFAKEETMNENSGDA